MKLLCPRTEAVLTGEFPNARIVGLAMELERELSVQTDLANHFRAETVKLKARLAEVGQTVNDNPVD